MMPTTKVRLAINPVPASRPRVERWGVRYNEPYKSFKEQAKELVAESWPEDVFDDACTVLLEIVKQKPKTTKLAFPKPDIDNFEKAVYDAMSKLVFKDDSQIQMAVVGKRWTREGEEPHISVTVARQTDRSWTRIRGRIKSLWESILG